MRLQQQIEFLKEIDTLKSVLRQTHIADESRRENTAEHSWHIAMAAITLSEYADEPVDILRVLKMLLVHDIVEIDAGDTFAFDETGYEDKFERETRAANRIFGILPDEQRSEFMTIWQEFEAAESNDALFANAIDRLMPFLHNIWSDGRSSWERHAPRFEQVYQRNATGAGKVSQVLWVYIQGLIDKAVADGWLAAPKN
ncbi:MAG: HD domain-containing protein [Phototrophicaceae bacterium]